MPWTLYFPSDTEDQRQSAMEFVEVLRRNPAIETVYYRLGQPLVFIVDFPRGGRDGSALSPELRAMLEPFRTPHVTPRSSAMLEAFRLNYGLPSDVRLQTGALRLLVREHLTGDVSEGVLPDDVRPEANLEQFAGEASLEQEPLEVPSLESMERAYGALEDARLYLAMTSNPLPARISTCIQALGEALFDPSTYEVPPGAVSDEIRDQVAPQTINTAEAREQIDEAIALAQTTAEGRARLGRAINQAFEQTAQNVPVILDRLRQELTDRGLTGPEVVERMVDSLAPSSAPEPSPDSVHTQLLALRDGSEPPEDHRAQLAEIITSGIRDFLRQPSHISTVIQEVPSDGTQEAIMLPVVDEPPDLPSWVKVGTWAKRILVPYALFELGLGALVEVMELDILDVGKIPIVRVRARGEKATRVIRGSLFVVQWAPCEPPPEPKTCWELLLEDDDD